MFGYQTFEEAIYDSRIKFLTQGISLIERGVSDSNLINQYLHYFTEDLKQLYLNFSYLSSFEEGFKPRLKLKFSFDSNLKISAYIQTDIDVENNKFIVTCLSDGFIMAIDDLAFRSCCSKSFISKCSVKDMIFWNGTQCFWPQSKLVPVNRFLNYGVVENSNFDYPLNTSFGWLFSGVPVGDYDRMYLGALLSFLGKMFILFHENSHYWHGHLFYVEDSGLFTKKILSETVSSVVENSKKLNRTIEWQADRNAILALIGSLFSSNGLPIQLPRFINSGNSLEWELRILFVSIGNVMMMLHKETVYNKQSKFYPSPRTRLISMFKTATSFLMDLKEKRNENHHLKKISISDLKLSIFKSIVNSLTDLRTVQAIMINEVEFADNNLKSNFNEDDLEKLDIIPENRNDIINLAKKILDIDSENFKKSEWFNEFAVLVQNHNTIYNSILKPYREYSELSGRSPFTVAM